MNDDWFTRPERPAGIGFAFLAWFAFCTLISLAMLGLMAWALIELVLWVTSK